MSRNTQKVVLTPIKRKERWYFGGIASCIVAFTVHPLDTIKVQMQTHQGKNIGILFVGKNIVKTAGIKALYNGLGATLCRQASYSGSRFAIYGIIRETLTKDGRKQTFSEKLGGAAFAGALSSVVGGPFELVSVRMQNDTKLPENQRRNYKWTGNALARIIREEGIQRIFKGGSFVAIRGVCMTVGQLAFYDTIKTSLLTTPYFDENIITHFSASITAGVIATTFTQPVDVIKTRIQDAIPGQYSGYYDVIITAAKLGPTAFFKGLIPRMARIVPMTLGIFVTLEQLTKHFGYAV